MCISEEVSGEYPRRQTKELPIFGIFSGDLTDSCTATDGQALFTERTRNETIFQSRDGIK